MQHLALSQRLPVDLAFEGLREERQDCVRRLQEMLAADAPGIEVEDALARIDTINQALMRLARSQIVH